MNCFVDPLIHLIGESALLARQFGNEPRERTILCVQRELPQNVGPEIDRG
jgi:hypothetical protein